MKKFIQSRSAWEMAIVSVFSFFAATGLVMAATTIGTDITTGGNIYATSTLLMDGASTFKGTVTLSAADLKFSTGYGLDSTGAVLNIGTTTATTINIGSTGATVAIRGNLTIPGAYSIDAVTGVLNIGTSTATAINIGKASITTTNIGTFSTATSTVGGYATTTTEGVVLPTSRTAAPVTCSAAYNGGLAYNSGTKNLCICIGTTWVVASSSVAVTCF